MVTGSLRRPLAKIKVDEKNCFGMIEWKAAREAASRFLPKPSAAAWKHRNLSYVEQEGLLPMPKDRGAEQGDVDSPLECSLALGMVAAESRGSTAAQQAAGALPWIGVNDPAEEQRLQADHAARMQESANFQLGGPEKLTGAHDPQRALQISGGLADQWYMDDGDIMCHPILVPSFLKEFDVANARVGAERNPLKTEVIYYVNDLDAAPAKCRVGVVRSVAKTSAVCYSWQALASQRPACAYGSGCARIPHPGSRLGDLHAGRLGVSLRGSLLPEGPAVTVSQLSLLARVPSGCRQ